MLDIAIRLLSVQGVEMIPGGDTLVELAELGLREQLLELRLPDQDYLYQLLLLGLDVGEHAYLLQNGGQEVLGLVDYEDHVLAPHAFLEQEPVKLGCQIPLCVRRGVYAEILVYRLEKLNFG